MRLKKLARPTGNITQGAVDNAEAKKKHEVGWESVFSGKKPVEVELGKWDKHELDSRAYQISLHRFLALMTIEYSPKGAGEVKYSNSFSCISYIPGLNFE